MAEPILFDSVEVDNVKVRIKFNITPATSSILNSKFKVFEITEEDSVELTDPFETINLGSDYNSIAKFLTLYWKSGKLDPDSRYEMLITGLMRPDGSVIADNDEIGFTTGESVTPTPSELPPEPPALTIVDYSIVRDVFDNTVQTEASFKLSESTPLSGDAFLPPDYNKGRVEIELTKRPSPAYVNSSFIKVQKRPIQRRASRWETVNDARISLDTNDSIVYIDFPAVNHYPELATPLDLDQTTIYVTSGYEYFEENYKYRIILSKKIAVQ